MATGTQHLLIGWNHLLKVRKTLQIGKEYSQEWENLAIECELLERISNSLHQHHIGTGLTTLRLCIQNNSDINLELSHLVDQHLRTIHKQIKQYSQETSNTSITTEKYVPKTLLIVLVVLDIAPLYAVLLQLEHYGYEFKTFDEVFTATEYALENKATAVLLETAAEFSQDLKTCIKKLNEEKIKWYALSSENSFLLRLNAVRLESQGYFMMPLKPNVLIDTLDRIAYKAEQEPYRVLVLDDSNTVLASIEKTLGREKGVQTLCMNSPTEILTVLDEFAPDVILLDFHMDGCTGLEVARVIRQQIAFESIPILYLTSETSQAIQLEALRHGGDDFLSKPVGTTQLISVVTSKAERYRNLRRMMVEDGLTGLFNHSKTKAMLAQTMLMAKRLQQSLCYVMIDIDHFKSVNDKYGHAVGDKVIKALARFLKQSLRTSDVVGRYGGEEFALILLNTDSSKALKVVEKIREGFGALQHNYDDGVFHVTLSAGIAHFPAYENALDLTVAADEALYTCKRNGRNQTALAPLSTG